MEDSVLKIQRCFRRWFYRNALCPISHEKMYHPCFIYKPDKTKSVCIFYDYISLNNYFHFSKKLVDPTTKLKYSNEDYNRFTKGLKKYFSNEKICSFTTTPINPLEQSDSVLARLVADWGIRYHRRFAERYTELEPELLEQWISELQNDTLEPESEWTLELQNGTTPDWIHRMNFSPGIFSLMFNQEQMVSIRNSTLQFTI